MEIQFFCPRWGSEQVGWGEFLGRVRDEGYNGIEYGISGTMERHALDEIWNKAEQRGIPILAQHYDTADADFGRHYATYNKWLELVKDYPVVKINSQTGRDFFSFEQNKALIDAASRFSAASGIEVVHETHRHKFSFAAHVTKGYLDKLSGFRITLDVSHWVCVAESFLEDQPDAMEAAIGRTGHIHARVGYPEGPQIADPRVPEWQVALEHHLRWWDAVAALYRKQESPEPLTITPEFGPYPYMQQLPFTRQPITDQWEVNAWMMRLLRERYQKK